MIENLYIVEQIVLPRDEHLLSIEEGKIWSENLLSQVSAPMLKTLHITAPPGIKFILNNGVEIAQPPALIIGPSGCFNIEIQDQQKYQLTNLQINLNDYNNIKDIGFVIIDIVSFNPSEDQKCVWNDFEGGIN